MKDKLISWYISNKRDLPWRHTNDPYKIWVSEIILQQTRVNQGIDYYNKFIKYFPSIKELANADIDLILKIWQGLGYYSRARNMYFAANQIMNEMNGNFPNNYRDILKLKGVGRYTAAAIASIAFGEKISVIDGNVFRIIARYKGIFVPINSVKAYNTFFSIVNNMLGDSISGLFNQALMELGAIICIPHNPVCDKCPIATDCYANINNKINVLPVKGKKPSKKMRYFNYIVIENNNHIVVKKRNQNDIWKSLYDFPLIETNKEINKDILFTLPEIKHIGDLKKENLISISDNYIHKLTHQTIIAKFFKFRLQKTNKMIVADFQNIELSKIYSLPVSRLIEKYLQNEFGFNK